MTAARCIAVAILLVGTTAAQARSIKDAPRESPANVTLPAEGEPGEPMILTITVEDAAGKPVDNALVYAFHTDAKGSYGPAGNEDPRIFAYARTRADGKVTLRTIRPGAYPQGSVPAHVHVEVDGGGGAPVLYDECWFAGDRYLREDVIEHERKRGRLSRVVALRKEKAVWRGDWVVQLPGSAKH